MHIEDIYQIVSDRLNKGSSGHNQKISKRLFVMTFNKAQLHWMEERMKVDEINQVRQTELQQFITETCLVPSKGKNKEYLFIDTPDDFFHYKRVEGLICGECEHTVYAYPREEGNVNRLLQDRFSNPNLYWQETFFTIGDNKIKFYTDNKFNCKQLLLIYYRCPREVDCEGIQYADRVGVNVNSELDKINLQEVIDITVQILSGDIGDQFRYGITSNRISNG